MIKLGYTPEEAGAALGGMDLLHRMVKAKWLAPVLQGNRKTLYSGGDLARAWARLEKKENLPQLPRNKPRATPARKAVLAS